MERRGNRIPRRTIRIPEGTSEVDVRVVVGAPEVTPKRRTRGKAPAPGDQSGLIPNSSDQIVEQPPSSGVELELTPPEASIDTEESLTPTSRFRVPFDWEKKTPDQTEETNVSDSAQLVPETETPGSEGDAWRLRFVVPLFQESKETSAQPEETEEIKLRKKEKLTIEKSIKRHEAKKAKREMLLRKHEAKKTKLQIEKSIKRHEAKKAKREMLLKKQPDKEARRLKQEESRKANEIKKLEWLKRQEPKTTKKLVDRIKKKVKKYPRWIIAGTIGAGATSLVAAAVIFAVCESSPAVSPDRTPTPSGPVGSPTPEPTDIPILTVTPTKEPAPTATEVVKTPDFGVKYNSSTEECTVVDRNTGKAVDISNPASYERVSYQETGIGVTKIITKTLESGQTAIIQGWKVDGQGDGVFKAIIADKKITANFTISDGAVEVIATKDAPFAFCNAVRIAVEKGFAHEKVQIPNAWKVN